MNKMNKKTEYALMALNVFNDLNLKAKQQGQSGEYAQQTVSAKDIAEKTHAPYDVVARVLQVLSSRGILRAEYGVMGGYTLNKNLSEITLHDLIEILETSTDLAKCLGSDSECDLAKNCTIMSPIQKLNHKVQNFYKSIPLSEVLNV